MNARLPDTDTEEFMIPARDAGIELYVRNRHPRGQTAYGAERTLLFVHGSTYPAEAVFDYPLKGLSWMQYIAQRGFDVYLVDVRGYGRSTRPAAMDAPPGEGAPVARTMEAVEDVGAAVDFICKRRGITAMNLMGWSWGTTIMSTYTSRHNARVHKLVLNAPQWLRDSKSTLDAGGPLGAWRAANRETTRGHWFGAVPSHKVEEIIAPAEFDAWLAAAMATDPGGAKMNPPCLRAPNGTLLDTREFWTQGKPPYDPADIRVPVLMTHAEWDLVLPARMAHELYAKLVNVPYKRHVEFSEGTHYLMLEKNRMQVLREVQHFLEEECVAGE
ncbi:MAG: alpha/beta hydrolase [Burkholderiales bacterium]